MASASSGSGGAASVPSLEVSLKEERGTPSISWADLASEMESPAVAKLRQGAKRKADAALADGEVDAVGRPLPSTPTGKHTSIGEWSPAKVQRLLHEDLESLDYDHVRMRSRQLVALGAPREVVVEVAFTYFDISLVGNWYGGKHSRYTRAALCSICDLDRETGCQLCSPWRENAAHCQDCEIESRAQFRSMSTATMLANSDAVAKGARERRANRVVKMAQRGARKCCCRKA